jgi:hypothetical protein
LILTADERARLEAHLVGDAEWGRIRSELEARISLPRLLARRTYEALVRYAIMRGLIRPERVAELTAPPRAGAIDYPSDDGVV